MSRPSPRESTTPLIQHTDEGAPQPQVDGHADDRDPKTGKRRFFGLGKKKEDKQAQQQQKDMAAAATTTPSAVPPVSQPTSSAAMRAPSPEKGAADLKPYPQPIPISPSRQNPYPSPVAASPSRLRSSSPRLYSPASSEIFERNVQEPVQISQLQGELSDAHIPTHVITEDHIPPALEASAQAITSEELDPDEVEIVTSASHQPASSVLEGSTSHADLTQLNTPLSPLQHVRSDESEPTSMHQSGILPPGMEEDGASNYGSLDPTDVRRLSFISFADVVQSEHQQAPTSALSEPGARDSLHVASLPGSFKQDMAMYYPRSPTSTHSHSMSGGVTTPPPSVSVDPAVNQSPGRSVVASPVSPAPHSELTIETMRQAVRKTASGDLSGGRSAGMSPVSDENLPSAPRSRTNS